VIVRALAASLLFRVSVKEPSMSHGHHVESPDTHNQVLAITANIARGRDVLAALAAAWSSSAHQFDPGPVADDAPILTPSSDSRPESQPPSGRSSK
jgi:hypothetical protein